MNTSRSPSIARVALLASALLLTTSAVTAADPPKASPEMKSEAMDLAKLCRADAQRLCSSVEPGGGRKLTCLKSHASELSPECRDALPKADALKKQAIQQGVMPK